MGAAERHADEALVTRAGIRDAALIQFAERGFDGATIRGIAEAAGVSPGLVQHHFGSKESLREACDAYAMEITRRTTQDQSGKRTDPGFMSVMMQVTMPARRYLARAMADGSPAAAALFDDMVDYTVELLRNPPAGFRVPPSSNLRAYAITMVAMTLGPHVLHEHMSRAFGTDIFTTEGYPPVALAMLEIFTMDIFDPEVIEQVRAALGGIMHASPAEPAPPQGDGDDE